MYILKYLKQVFLFIISQLYSSTTSLIFPFTRYTADDRPGEVPFAIPNEMELLDMATRICQARLIHPSSEPEGRGLHQPLIKLTSSGFPHRANISPPAYDDVVNKLGSFPSSTFSGTVIKSERSSPECPSVMPEQTSKRLRLDEEQYNARSTPPFNTQSLIDNILRASLMTSSPQVTSPELPFSPLSPDTQSTWPALHALLG